MHPNIGIIPARKVIKSFHTTSQMITKCGSTISKTIERLDYYCGLTLVLSSEFRSTNEDYLFTAGRSEIIIMNISFKNIKVIDCGYSKISTKTFLWDISSISGFHGRVSCVVSSNKSGFAAEVPLEIKYKATIDMFISYRVFFTVIQDTKINSSIGNLFLYHVTPKIVVIILVKSVRFFGRGRYIHTKCLGLLEETCFDLSDYVILLLQSIGYPPSKGGFSRNPIPYNILGNIYRVWFLDILQ